MIFRPGFSTNTTVTEISGRGVGMDVVREHLEHLNGLVEVDSTLGQGTRFTMRVPLTLATSRTLLVEQGEQHFAIPSPMVERTGRVRESALRQPRGPPRRHHRGSSGRGGRACERARTDAPADLDPHRDDDWRPYLVLRQGERRVALLVDRLVGEQGIVVKSLDWPLRRVRNVGGATVLGSGEVVVILNPTDLLKTALRLQQAAGAVAIVAQPERRRHRLLVVDDSLTTRTLLGSILEAAGYDVLGGDGRRRGAVDPAGATDRSCRV